MHHLILALRPRQFNDSLIKKPTKNLDELKNWAIKFMQIEELCDFHKNARVDNEGDKRKEKDRGIRHIPGQFDKIRDNRGPQFHTYSPLNADRDKIMDEALHADLIPELKKQCRYHRKFGNTIEECQALKDKIEELVQVGHLRNFVQTTNRSSFRSPQRERYPSLEERREPYPRYGKERSQHLEDDRRPMKQQRRRKSPKRGNRSRRSESL